jgi:Fuseless-like protein (putative pre-synaptic calcium channel regulator)
MLNKLKETFPLAKLKQYPSLNAIIILIAMIMLWRGVWGLLDIYLFPGVPTLSYLLSILFGIFILYLDDFSLSDLKKITNPAKKSKSRDEE